MKKNIEEKRCNMGDNKSRVLLWHPALVARCLVFLFHGPSLTKGASSRGGGGCPYPYVTLTVSIWPIFRKSGLLPIASLFMS